MYLQSILALIFPELIENTENSPSRDNPKKKVGKKTLQNIYQDIVMILVQLLSDWFSIYGVIALELIEKSEKYSSRAIFLIISKV